VSVRGNILIMTSLFLLLGGCAEVLTQPSSDSDPARDFAAFAAKWDRLNDVAMGLSATAATLCTTHVQATYGFELHDKSEYARLFKGEYLEAAVQYYGLQDGVSVRYVHPTLPAGAAGLRSGGRIISLDGEPLDTKTAEDAREFLRRFERRNEGPLHVVFTDAEARVHERDLYAVPACKYPILLVRSKLVNAFADGTKIVVTTGMLDFTASDAELAVVIGHEIAHNALAHTDDIRLRNVLDAVLTAHTGQRADLAATATGFSFPEEFETQADYMGLYIAARAGYDINGAGQFWGRLARYHPTVNAPAFGITHPSYPERFDSFRSTLREIGKKQERGEALLPDRMPALGLKQSTGPEDREEPEKATVR
jgi:Peptidase family M48